MVMGGHRDMNISFARFHKTPFFRFPFLKILLWRADWHSFAGNLLSGCDRIPRYK